MPGRRQAFYPEPGVRAGARGNGRSSIRPRSCLADCGYRRDHVVIRRPARGSEEVALPESGSNTVIGPAVELGDDCRVAANVTLSHCVIGARVVLHPGVRIGQPGFGFAPDPVRPVKIPQLGRVMIGDDVDIGANTTIDRGSGHDTVIGPGTMIDNLVQIGHNVRIGRGCVLVAQVGISGSTTVGDYVMIAGQALRLITGHLKIGDGARIAAQTGVARDVAAGETVGGSPAVPMTEWLRTHALLRRMARKKDRG